VLFCCFQYGPADIADMASDLQTLLRLEVPVIVRLGERTLTVAEVVDLVPGAIIELPKRAEDELDLLVNNKQIGTGTAVKVGENFGLRISFIGDARARIAALGGEKDSPIPSGAEDTHAAALASV
jgi:flagellar motor switch protein FliN/FliY